MQKHLLSLSLVLSLILGLMMPGSAVDASADTEPREIIFWHSMSETAGEAMEQIVDEFNAGPGGDLGIHVESVFQGSYSDATSKLRTIIQAGQTIELPDVMQIDATGIVSYQSTEATFTVDEAITEYEDLDLERFMEVPLAYWNFDGVQLGLPFSTSTTVTYYNKTLLDEAGFAEAPTTFAEIIDLSEALAETSADGAKLYAFGGVPNTPTLANWIGQIPGKDVDSSYVLDALNGRGGTATRVIAGEEGTLRHFLTEWKAMYDAGALMNEPASLTDLWVAGQIAMITNSSSGLGYLPELVGDNFEMGVSYFPRIDENSNFGATVSGSGVFMFDRLSGENKRAAWEFTRYLVSPEVQADFSMASGYFPSNKDSYDLDEFKAFAKENPAILTVVEQVEETSPDMMGIVIGPAWDFYMEIQNQIFLMLDEDLSVEETTETLVKVLDDLLQTYKESNPEE